MWPMDKKLPFEKPQKTFYSFFEQDVNVEFSGESRPGDPNNWQADIGNLKKLGYKQSYSLEQGLENYFKWLKERD